MTLERHYVNTAQPTTLLTGCNATDTVLALVDTTGFPTQFPFTLVIDGDNSLTEVVTVNSQSGNSVTVLRGQDGTSGVAHSTGANVIHAHSARDFQEYQDHQASDVAHGAVGQVVGTENTQTLINKTLEAADGGVVAAIVKGADNQLAHLLDFRDASDNVVGWFDVDGDGSIAGSMSMGTLQVAPLDAASIAVTITRQGASVKRLLQLIDTADNDLFFIDFDGTVTANALLNSVQLSILPTDSNSIPLLITQMDGSTADLLMVKDSSSNPLFNIEFGGDVNVTNRLAAGALFAQPIDVTDIAVAGRAMADSTEPIFQATTSGGTHVWKVDVDGNSCGPTTTGDFDRTTASYAIITLGTSQVIQDTNLESVNFDTEGAGTTDESMVGLAGNKLTAPRDGTYVITGRVMWDSASTGARLIRLTINDGERVFESKKRGCDAWTAAGSDPQDITQVFRLNAGDYVKVEVTQDSGGPLNLSNQVGPTDNSLAMSWVAP